MCNTIKKLRNKFRKLLRRFKWYWFIKTNTTKVSNLLIKHDPCSLICIKDNIILNTHEYISEAEDLLNLINFYGGIKEINVNLLHNLVYLVFVENHIVFMDLQNGNPIIQSIEELEKFIGPKDRYLPIAEEINKLLS